MTMMFLAKGSWRLVTSLELSDRCADNSHSTQSVVDSTTASRLSSVNGRVSCQNLDFPGKSLLWYIHDRSNLAQECVVRGKCRS